MSDARDLGSLQTSGAAAATTATASGPGPGQGGAEPGGRDLPSRSPGSVLASLRESGQLGRFLLRNTLVGILIIIALGFTFTNGNFASVSNLRSILLDSAALSLVAFGETFVIITAGIDLSVGSIIGFSGVVCAVAIQHGWSFPLAALGGVLAGGLVGVINGLLVSVAEITPFIVTLGTLSAALSAGYILSNGRPVSPNNDGLINFGINTQLGVPEPVWIALGILLVLWVVLSKTTYGLHIYAVGGNPAAARLSGVKNGRILCSVYTIAGILAGLAGVIVAARVTSGIATNGNGFELTAIAAAVIGGVSLFGGRGSIWGAALGIILLSTLTNGMNVLNVSPFYQGLVQGALVVFAVFLDGLYQRIYGDT